MPNTKPGKGAQLKSEVASRSSSGGKKEQPKRSGKRDDVMVTDVTAGMPKKKVDEVRWAKMESFGLTGEEMLEGGSGGSSSKPPLSMAEVLRAKHKAKAEAEPVKATGDDVEKAIAESLKPEYLPEIVDDDQEEGRREIAIAELVKPHKKMKMREPVRRPETIPNVTTSDFEKAIVESLRPEYLPEESEIEGEDEKNSSADGQDEEWEVADGSVFSFDMMSVTSKAVDTNESSRVLV